VVVSERNSLIVACVEVEEKVEFPSYPPRKDLNPHKVEDDGEDETRRRLENTTAREAVFPMPRNGEVEDERLAATRRMEEDIIMVVAKRIRRCIVVRSIFYKIYV